MPVAEGTGEPARRAGPSTTGSPLPTRHRRRRAGFRAITPGHLERALRHRLRGAQNDARRRTANEYEIRHLGPAECL